MKSILATVGLLALIGAIAIWQFGFFSEKAKDVSLQVERATAASRAESSMNEMSAKIAKLDDAARKYRVEARKIEIVYEREQKAIDELNAAMSRLAKEAKDKGLPKPKDKTLMTEEQAASTFTFGTKTISARDVYPTLERWESELKQKEEIAKQKKTTIDRMRGVCDQIAAKKSEMTVALEQMRSRLSELDAAKDMANLNAELAEMEASVNGVAAGDSGKAMQTIQDEIDELNAIAETYQEDAQVKKDELNPSDITTQSSESSSLDALWDAE